MKKLFLYAFFIAIVIAVGSAVKPYWNKYWIQRELEVAAVYGTKNTVEHTKAFLVSKLKEEGYRIGEDRHLHREGLKEQRHHNGYGIPKRFPYLGKELRKLHFTLTATEREIKAYY